MRWLFGTLLLVALVVFPRQGPGCSVALASAAASMAHADVRAMVPGGTAGAGTGALEAVAGSLLLVGLVFSAVALLGLRACGQRGYIRRLRPYRWR